MKNEIFCVPDGLEELKQSMSTIIDLIARTARWVHPDTFRVSPGLVSGDRTGPTDL